MNQTVRYILDADDRIRAVDGDWVDFAVANGARELASSVVGTPLWAYISDRTTRHLYELILRRARERQESVRIPFRCDAPDAIREMELEIHPREDRSVEFISRTLATRPREALPLLDPSASRTETFVRMCGWCKRMEHDGRWKELEEALRDSAALGDPPLPMLTHGICDDCTKGLEAMLEEPAAG